MSEDGITIKPHHFIDIICFNFGTRDYDFKPHPYGHAVHTVAEKLYNDRDIEIELFSGADDICKPCIHNIDGICDDMIDTSFRPEAPSSKREWNLLIDNRWYKRLGLKDGDRLKAREYVLKVREALTGGIEDIYMEIPADMNASRLDKLKQGIEEFIRV